MSVLAALLLTAVAAGPAAAGPVVLHNLQLRGAPSPLLAQRLRGGHCQVSGVCWSVSLWQCVRRGRREVRGVCVRVKGAPVAVPVSIYVCVCVLGLPNVMPTALNRVLSILYAIKHVSPVHRI